MEEDVIGESRQQFRAEMRKWKLHKQSISDLWYVRYGNGEDRYNIVWLVAGFNLTRN
jgi:5-keto 4-deoxyuronate isomerase